MKIGKTVFVSSWIPLEPQEPDTQLTTEPSLPSSTCSSSPLISPKVYNTALSMVCNRGSLGWGSDEAEAGAEGPGHGRRGEVKLGLPGVLGPAGCGKAALGWTGPGVAWVLLTHVSPAPREGIPPHSCCSLRGLSLVHQEAEQGLEGPRLPPSQATSPGSQQMDDVLEFPSGLLLKAYPLPGGPQWEGGVL